MVSQISRRATMMIERKAPAYMRLGLATDLKLHFWFYSIGLVAHRRRYWIIAATLLLVAVFTPFTQTVQFDSASTALFLNHSSPYTLVGHHMGNRQQFSAVVVAKSPQSSLQPFLSILEAAHGKVIATKAEGNAYTDLCQEAVPSQLLVSGERVKKKIGPCFAALPGSNLSSAIPALPQVQLVNQTSQGIKAVRATWQIEPILEAGEARFDRAKYDRMVYALQEQLYALPLADGMSLFFVAWAVPTPDVAANTIRWLFFLAAVMMLLGMRFSLQSKVLVGATALLTVTFSLYLCLAFVLVVGIVPNYMLFIAGFYLISIGVDDCVLILQAVQRTDRQEKPARRLARALSESATSIFTTTVTDVLVFVPGIFSASKALSFFSAFLVAGLVVDFCLQLTFFCAVLAIDLEREAARRVECLCCIVVKDASSVGDVYEAERDEVELQAVDEDGNVHIKSHDSPNANDTRGHREGTPSSSDMGTSVTASNNAKHVQVQRRSVRSHTVDSMEETIRAEHAGQAWAVRWGKFSTTRAGNIVNGTVLLLLIGLMAYGSVLGFTSALRGVDRVGGTAARAPGSVSDVALATVANVFPGRDVEVSFMVQGHLKLWQSSTRTKVLRACDLMATLPASVAAPGMTPRCFLRSMLDWHAVHANTTSLDTEAGFVQVFKDFTASSDANAQMRKDVTFDATRTRLLAARVVAWTQMVELADAAVNQMNAVEAHMKEVIDNGVMPPANFAYANIRNTYLLVEEITTMVLTSVALVLITTSVLLINPFTSLIVALSMLVSISGTVTIVLMSGTGLTNFALLMSLVTLSGGVDFSAHMVLHFNTAQGSPQERVVAMFASIGSSVAGGYISSASSIVLLLNTNGGGITFLLVLQGSLLCSLLFAWFAVPLLLQFTNPPMALRSVEQEQKLQSSMAQLDVMEASWRRNKGSG